MAQEFEQPIALRADRRARRHHHAVAAGTRELMRQQQLIAAVRHRAIERRHDDHVEFQSLGFVNGHDFHGARSAMIGIQIRKGLRQIGCIRQPALLQLPQARKSCASEFEVLRRRGAARPAQFQPCTLHPSRHRTVVAHAEGGFQCREHPQATRTPVLAQLRQEALIMQRIPDQRSRACDSQQIRKTESRPRRAQHRKPRDAVAEVQQRA